MSVILPQEDFNRVAILLDRIKSLGSVLTAIDLQSDFPDDDLKNLGHMIEDFAVEAYKKMDSGVLKPAQADN